MMTIDLAKTVRRAGLAGFLALAVAAPVEADEIDDLRNELQQLKQQVTFLQNQIPQGGAVAARSSAAFASSMYARYGFGAFSASA